MSDALDYLLKTRPEAMKPYVETGQCVAKGDRPLRRFDHRVENGRLMAYW